MLWFKTSGRASKIMPSDAALPRQSEIRASTVVSGVRDASPGWSPPWRRRHRRGDRHGHAGDDCVAEPRPLHRLRHPVGLVG